MGEKLPIGLIKEDDMIFKVGLGCCTWGVKMPKVCIAGKQDCLCVKGAASFPFSDDFVGKPVCAICFFSVMPEVDSSRAPQVVVRRDRPPLRRSSAEANLLLAV